MDTTSPGTVLAIGLSLLLVAGYVWGSSVNRRLRWSLGRWARQGFRNLADGATIQTFGTSGVLIRQPHPRPDILDLQMTVLLEPREVTPLWLWHRFRGRQDFVVLRITLPNPARADLEIAARGSPFGQAAMRALTEADGWRVVERGETFTIAARRTREPEELAKDLLRTLTPLVPGLAQVSVRRGTTAVQVGFPLLPPETPLGPILDGLAAVAQRLEGGPR
jgi:hypothetical protein